MKPDTKAHILCDSVYMKDPALGCLQRQKGDGGFQGLGGGKMQCLLLTDTAVVGHCANAKYHQDGALRSGECNVGSISSQ